MAHPSCRRTQCQCRTSFSVPSVVPPCWNLHHGISFYYTSKLTATSPFPITALEKTFYFRKRHFLLNLSTMPDEYIPIFLIDFISHGNHDCLKLGKGRECILFGCINIIFRFSFSCHSQEYGQ